ncbi:MAG: diphthine--ammonia ligase [Candidatus Bathyarchaeota archaeon]|nr:diphthine--ammonia ligase [Candidatus Bathyarchaeota archaeon]
MKVAVLWTGGKDSALACHKTIKSGHEVAYVATLIWSKPSLAHSLSLIKLQSEAMNIPFLWDKLEEPYFEAYREAIIEMANEYGIKGIVTGDIAYVDDFHGNWIDKVCEGTGVEVIKPLWGMEREKILHELLSYGFKVILTSVTEPWLTKDWLGRTIDSKSITEIQQLHEKKGLDMCGEFGEYHTMTIDAPFFKKIIKIPQFKKLKTEKGYILKPAEVSLEAKWSSYVK